MARQPRFPSLDRVNNNAPSEPYNKTWLGDNLSKNLKIRRGIKMSINALRFVTVLSLFVLPLGTAWANQSIRTTVIPGREVDDMEVLAAAHGPYITVSGTGFEVFPNRTCGHPEITFLNSRGHVLLQKDTAYQKPDSRWSRTPLSEQDRWVSFSVTVPVSEPVASIIVQHRSNGRCEHDWSLQYALDRLMGG
jgi:hypothetical protein